MSGAADEGAPDVYVKLFPAVSRAAAKGKAVDAAVPDGKDPETKAPETQITDPTPTQTAA